MKIIEKVLLIIEGILLLIYCLFTQFNTLITLKLSELQFTNPDSYIYYSGIYNGISGQLVLSIIGVAIMFIIIYAIDHFNNQ